MSSGEGWRGRGELTNGLNQRPARRIDLLVVAVFRLRTIAKTYIHKNKQK